ncbi:hypothetical protein HDZ31DRAFT_44993 [Schizophyllum fasciatum]
MGHRHGTHSTTNRSIKESMNPALRRELEGLVHEKEIEIEDFVRECYGLDDGAIEHIKKLDITLPAEPLQIYEGVIAAGQHEKNLYAPFKRMFDACVATVCEQLGTQTDTCLQFYEALGEHVLKGVRDCERKPDGMILDAVACSDPSNISWRVMQHFVEFKKYSRSGQGGKKAHKPTLHDVQEEDEASTSSSKRLRQNMVNAQELQAGQYALECMDAPTSRWYSTCACIDKFEMWLMYYDRDRVFRSLHFNFRSSPRYLALVAYAMVRCTPVRAGFDPHLVFPISGDSDSEKDEKDDGTRFTSDVRYPRDLDGARFVFPKDQDQPAVTFVVQDSSPVSGYMGLAGRGTMVYPVKVLHGGDEDLVLKACWMSPGRTPEPEILRLLKEKLPDMTDYFPEVVASHVMKPERVFLDLLDDAMKRSFLESSRWLVYLASRRYMPLWELDTVEEFMSCYVDIVEVHFHAYKTAEVMHRDISENNAMARRKSADAPVVGVLNDWDLAAILKAMRIADEAAGHRTGTGPFMAIRLQLEAGQNDCPEQCYEHDLESLFWLLVWAVVHFDLENKCRRPTQLPVWEGQWTVAAKYKREFLTDSTALGRVIELALPPYKRLIIEWIFPLWTMFREAHLAADVAVIVGTELRTYYDDAIYRSKITFENFMQAIGRKPRQWTHEQKA